MHFSWLDDYDWNKVELDFYLVNGIQKFAEVGAPRCVEIWIDSLFFGMNGLDRYSIISFYDNINHKLSHSSP